MIIWSGHGPCSAVVKVAVPQRVVQGKATRPFELYRFAEVLPRGVDEKTQAREAHTRGPPEDDYQ